METPEVAALFLARQPDSVRWLPAMSPVDPRRPLVAATWDWATSSARLEAVVLTPGAGRGQGGTGAQQPLSPAPSFMGGGARGAEGSQGGLQVATAEQWALPGRCTSGVCAAPIGDATRQALLLAGTEAGDLVAALADGPSVAAFSAAPGAEGGPAAPKAGKVTALIKGLHAGPIAAVDFQAQSGESLSAGADGRLLTWKVERGGAGDVRVLGAPDGADMAGGLEYSCARWLSPSQAVSAVVGGGVRWWDRRQSPAQTSARSPLQWKTLGLGALTAFHVHPTRQHLCVAGGSNGTLIAWDLRNIAAPLLLCGSACKPVGVAKGVGLGSLAQMRGVEAAMALPALSQSDVLDVRFDPLLHLQGLTSTSSDSSLLPPVLACTDDGAVVACSNGELTNLFWGTSSILSFDVEPGFGQHLICALDYEHLAYLFRPKIV